MILRRWLGGPAIPLSHIHPGWFLAPVGNVIAPVAGVNFAPNELVWTFFAIGVAYWITVLPILVFRLITADPLPAKLSPTVAMLIAPPAVAAIAWVKLGHAWTEPFPLVLLGLASFQALLLASQVGTLRKAPFAPSAWAYTFPLAALAIALLSASADLSSPLCRWAGAITLGSLTIVVLTVGTRTLMAAFRGEFTRSEPAALPAA